MMTAPQDAASSATHIALRLVLATALVLTAAYFFSRDAVRLLMPMLESALSSVASDYKILRFDFFDERNNTSIGAIVRLEHTLVLGGRAIVPDGQSVMGVAATIGTVLQPVCVAMVLALAWPAHWREMLLRLLIIAPLLTAVLLVDTPLSMAAWLWDVQLRMHEPGRASPLVWWNTFLNGGGRLALGLIAAALSIALARRLAHPSTLAR
jgi:hypothetical protein